MKTAPDKGRYLPLVERRSYRGLEDVVGCKWSAAVVAALSLGVQRPGELERFIPGISTKVLNERLRKLLDYGLITRTRHDERVLRVEYQLTATGRKLAAIIDQLRELDEEHAVAPSSALGTAAPVANRRSSGASARAPSPTRPQPAAR